MSKSSTRIKINNNTDDKRYNMSAERTDNDTIRILRFDHHIFQREDYIHGRCERVNYDCTIHYCLYCSVNFLILGFMRSIVFK